MKVAQLLYAGLGGHGSVAFSLLDADEKQEWLPCMVFVGIEPLLPAYAKKCKTQAIEYSYIQSISGKPWRNWRKIFNDLNGFLPNAIILHSPSSLLPCFWYSWLRGIPLVVVEHQSNGLKRRSDWIFSYLSMLLADKVVLLTPVYKHELKGRLGWWFRKKKVNVIPNGIDSQKFIAFSQAPNRGRSVRVGMASRFTSTKRQDVLVSMMRKLIHREPDIDWQLSLAGDGENCMRIKELISNNNLEYCISMPGQLDESELIKWFQSLDIYLHASEGETLSTALLQAMGTGVPIVASDVPGIRNLIATEMPCGLLADDQSPESFANLVIQLSKDVGISTALGSTGRQLAISIYSQDAMFAGYTKLLQAHAQKEK